MIVSKAVLKSRLKKIQLKYTSIVYILCLYPLQGSRKYRFFFYFIQIGLSEVYGLGHIKKKILVTFINYLTTKH